MKNCNLGIIGCGNMAQAVIESIARGGMREYEQNSEIKLNVFVSDPDAAKVDAATEKFGMLKSIGDNGKLVEMCDYVLLAVKPQVYREALKGISFKGKTVISIMAGVPIAKIKENIGADKVVRVMPNLNAKILRSYNAYCVDGLEESSERFVHALLSGFGLAVKVPEDRLDAVTGLTGSGPAFVFMFFKAFAETAQKFGFERADALKAAESVITASAHNLASDVNVDIDKMIDSVCSKGGTTIEGVNYLREHDFVSVTEEAIERAIKRSEELGKQL